jgi:hypothetical protein
MGAPLLFPADTAKAVIADPGDPVAVRAGPLEGLRYRGERRSGSGKATLFVYPTSDGSLVVSCAGPAPGALAACERAAGSARLADARPVSPTALAAYARHASRVLDRLSSQRVRDRRLLRRARRRSGQARAARRLAADHRTAARGLQRGAPAAVGSEVRSLDRSLRSTAAAYTALARAAGRGDRRRYRAAARAVRRSEARTARAVRRL